MFIEVPYLIIAGILFVIVLISSWILVLELDNQKAVSEHYKECFETERKNRRVFETVYQELRTKLYKLSGYTRVEEEEEECED